MSALYDELSIALASRLTMRLLLPVLLLLAACQRTSTGSDPPEFVAARAAILALLRDPDSVRFGTFQHGRGGAVCGTVNARNGFGGYSGARPFAWSADAGAIFYEFEGELWDWRERGRVAERFAELGCTIGPDQAKAIGALRALEESDRRLAE